MKAHITVLIDSSTPSIGEALRKSLEPYRLGEGGAGSDARHRWDYWFFPTEGPLDDNEFRKEFSGEPGGILENSAFVKNLPAGYSTSGIIRTDGSWIDLRDHGWWMADGPSESNRIALERWNRTMSEIFAEHADDVCVQVMVHC